MYIEGEQKAKGETTSLMRMQPLVNALEIVQLSRRVIDKERDIAKIADELKLAQKEKDEVSRKLVVETKKAEIL